MTTDAELASAIARGDTAAWADVFDRHRDAVWRVAMTVTRDPHRAEDVLQSTFLKAVERCHQLRDPARLRPWLLAIARSDALDRVRRPAHAELDDAAVPAVAGIDIGDLRRTEIGVLVQGALDGLAVRDRLALELAERCGLSGAELADALGVTPENAYVVVHNARRRFCRSVESLVVARTGTEDCLELRSLLADWDGALDTTWRKRLSRHIDGCDACAATRDREVTPAALLGAVPALVIPAGAAARIRASVVSAPPPPPSTAAPVATAAGGAGKLAAAALVATTAVLLTGAVVIGIRSVGPPSSVEGAAEAVPADVALVSAADDPAPGKSPDQGGAGFGPGSAGNATPAGSPPPGTPVAEARDSLCQLVGELMVTSAGGPAAGPGGIEAYMRATSAALDAVVTAGAGPATADYASAYRRLIDDEAWLLVPLPDDAELRALRDRAEIELASTCTS